MTLICTYCIIRSGMVHRMDQSFDSNTKRMFNSYQPFSYGPHIQSKIFVCHSGYNSIYQIIVIGKVQFKGYLILPYYVKHSKTTFQFNSIFTLVSVPEYYMFIRESFAICCGVLSNHKYVPVLTCPF